MRLSTSRVNRWLEGMLEAHPPPLVQGRRLRIRYATQVKTGRRALRCLSRVRQICLTTICVILRRDCVMISTWMACQSGSCCARVKSTPGNPVPVHAHAVPARGGGSPQPQPQMPVRYPQAAALMADQPGKGRRIHRGCHSTGVENIDLERCLRPSPAQHLPRASTPALLAAYADQ